MTLFSNYFDIENLDFPYTCFIIDKWKGFFKVCLILLNDLKDILLKCNLESLSEIIKDSNCFKKYHKNFNKYFELYSMKFKITGQELQKIRDDYYIKLAEDKLAKNEKWDKDQKKPLEKYLTEKEKIAEISKKYITNYKSLIEMIDKKYLLVLKDYNFQLKFIQHKKEKINELVDKKCCYEQLYQMFEGNLKNLEISDHLSSLKNDVSLFQYKQSQNELTKKKQMITKELNKVYEKYNPINAEYHKITKELYEDYEKLDKFKILIDKYNFDKSKRKKQMEDYLFQLEIKNRQLISELCADLKLSENFLKHQKF